MKVKKLNRFKMVHECFKKVNKFKNVQKGTVKVQDGSRWFNKVREDAGMFKDVDKCLRMFSKRFMKMKKGSNKLGLSWAKLSTRLAS